MKTFLIAVCSIVCFGCNFTYENNTNNDAALEQLRKETDSLKNEINALKKQSIKKDTLNASVVADTNQIRILSDSASNTATTKRVTPSKKKVAPPQKTVPKKSDTTFYYYTNSKKVSVKIAPRNVYGEKNKIQFYDRKGKVTFEQEDIHTSYSISTDIKEFHPNGAVARIVIHLNPGASMHWYETIITFDTDNTPLWKEEITYPMTLDNTMNNKSYWDVAIKQWVKQEVVIEQPFVK